VQLGRNPCLVIQIATQLLKVLRHYPNTGREFTLRSTSYLDGRPTAAVIQLLKVLSNKFCWVKHKISRVAPNLARQD
jgi:hypothetical protein